MNVDGTGERLLTNNASPYAHVAWSPDGRSIAFESDRDGNRAVYVMNADGADQRRLTDSAPAEDYGAHWSPDGRSIAFGSNRDGNHEVYVMNADGTGQRRLSLTNNAAPYVSMSWSPDGKSIALHSERDGNWEIYVMNADGTGQTTGLPISRTTPLAIWGPRGLRTAGPSPSAPTGTGTTRST